MTVNAPTTQRIRKGMTLAQVEALQEQQETITDAEEYLDHQVAKDPHDLEAIVRIPQKAALSNASAGSEEASSSDEPLLDQNAWIYESLRRVCRDLSSPWMLSLQQVCNRASCNEMKGGEWLYLCAAHASANETECCAIDYINHTLDAASALLCSKRYFPSRIGIPDTSVKHFTSISRRLYRIFSHAYYHHSDVYQDCEAESSLYARFKLLCTEFDIVSSETLAVPASFEGVPDSADVENQEEEPQRKLATREEAGEPGHADETAAPPEDQEEASDQATSTSKEAKQDDT